MKKIFYFIVALVCVTFVSCSQSDSGPDARDAFVGMYSATISMNVTMSIAGQNVSIPLAQGGTFQIIKDGDGNRIKLLGSFKEQNDTKIAGTVDGNILTLDPETVEKKENGATIVMVTEYKPAKLVGNKLTINATITGTAVSNGYVGSITGSGVIDATKQ